VKDDIGGSINLCGPGPLAVICGALPITRAGGPEQHFQYSQITVGKHVLQPESSKQYHQSFCSAPELGGFNMLFFSPCSARV
jgi:hypothetical protein